MILFYIVLFALCSTIRGLSDVPYFRKLPPAFTYTFDGENVSLLCDVGCRNCSNKWEITWLRNGEIVSNDANLVMTFNSTQHVGVYVCSVRYNDFVIRSTNTYLKQGDLPKFVLHPLQAFQNGTVVLQCVDSINKLLRNKLLFEWFKDGNLIKNTSTVMINHEILYLQNVQDNDRGLYSCRYKLHSNDAWLSSEQFKLDVIEGSAQVPYIRYISNSQSLYQNDSMTISCISGGSPKTIVRLFKVLKDTDVEKFLFESKVSAFLRITRFAEKDVGDYVCEAEFNRIRTRKKMTLHMVGAAKPKLKHNGITHLNSEIGGSVSFSCDHDDTYDSNITWYLDGQHIAYNNIVEIQGDWLVLRQITMEQIGAYQCVVENQYGSDMKTFYLTLNDAGLSPTGLKLTKNSPTSITLSWKVKKYNVDPLSIYHRIYWQYPTGKLYQGLTKETEVMIKEHIYGGLEYRFEVCTMSTSRPDIKDCVVATDCMLESKPMAAPLLDKPLWDKNIIRVHWEAPPKKLAMGVMKNYTIYLKKVHGGSVGTEFVYRIDDASMTSANIKVSGRGAYKIWMVGMNSVDQTPPSKTYVVSTERIWNYDLNEVEFSVSWKIITSQQGAYRPALKWKMIEPNDNLTHFRIFYVEIPYTDYWKSVKTVTVNKNVNQYVLQGLTPKKTYRFTIAPVYKHQAINDSPIRYLQNYGKRTHVILSPDINFRKAFFRHANSFNKAVPPPELYCYGTGRHSILISWSKPNTEIPIKDYMVYLTEERTGKVTTYYVEDTHLVIHNLTTVWHAVRVHANNPNLTEKVTFFESKSVACRTKIDVPSAPTNLTYTVLNSKTNLIHLNIQWQQPTYSGDSIYQYIIRKRDKLADNEPDIHQLFVFDIYYHVLMDQQHSKYIHSEGIPFLANGIRAEVEIIPYNDAGKGQSSKLVTTSIFDPKVIKHKSKHHKTQILLSTTPSTDNDNNHLTNGIIIGIGISSIFLLIFIVTCITQEPCRKTVAHDQQQLDHQIRHHHTGGDAGSNDNYLYLTRLDESQQRQTLLSELTCSTTCSSSLASTAGNRGGKRQRNGDSCHFKYKLLYPFNRLLSSNRSNRQRDSQQKMLSSTSSMSCSCNASSYSRDINSSSHRNCEVVQLAGSSTSTSNKEPDSGSNHDSGLGRLETSSS